MDTKDLIIDKAIDVSEYGKKTIKVAGGNLKHGVGNMARTTSDIIVNRSPDPYDELEDVAVDGTKQMTSHEVMIARNVYRGGRSINNVKKKHNNKVQWKKARWKKLDDTDRYNLYIKEFDKLSESEKIDIYKEIEPDFERLGKGDKTEFINNFRKSTRSFENTSFAKKVENKFTSNGWKKLNKFSKKSINSNIKAGLQISKSTKFTIRNQSRKIINQVSQSNDLGTKTVGKTMKIAWGTWTYRTRITQTIKLAFVAVKGAISAILSFVVSIPGIIATIIAVLPVIIIILIVVMVISLFTGTTEYSGRIYEFTNNEVRLEILNKVNVAPDEVLAITNVLGWSTQNVDDYERLFAIMMDGADETGRLSFECMMDNVFVEYNPATYAFEEGTIKYNTTGFFGNKSKTISFDEWKRLFPKYYKGSANLKKEYGSKSFITDLKKKAKEALDDNAKNYIGARLSNTEYFKNNPIKVDDISYGSSEYKLGIRSLLKDIDFHNGVDIGASAGTPVHAVFDAEVVWAQKNITAGGLSCASGTFQTCGVQLGGNQVVLRYKTFDREKGEPIYLYIAYFHLSPNSVTVKSGQKVHANDKIGEVGETGIADGAHLHFQAWLSKQKYEGSNYGMPYSKEVTVGNANLWQQYMDATMFTDIEFRNKIYGR